MVKFGNKLLVLIIFIFIWTSFALTANAQSVKFIASFNDWYVYTYNPGADLTCFMQSQPIKRLPTGVNRDPTFYMVANYSGGAKHEISVEIGYPFKGSDSASSVIDGADKFLYFTKSSVAFLHTVEDESKIVEKMKSGKQMVYTGLSSRGTTTTDTYSLSGFTKALERIDQLCK